jgi:hypothetical protein
MNLGSQNAQKIDFVVEKLPKDLNIDLTYYNYI